MSVDWALLHLPQGTLAPDIPPLTELRCRHDLAHGSLPSAFSLRSLSAPGTLNGLLSLLFPAPRPLSSCCPLYKEALSFARLFPSLPSEGNLNISCSRKPSVTALFPEWGLAHLWAPLPFWAHSWQDVSVIIAM